MKEPMRVTDHGKTYRSIQDFESAKAELAKQREREAEALMVMAESFFITGGTNKDSF